MRPSLLDQHHPVVVSALMAQVAEERAVGLTEVLALALALDRVRFHDVDGDHAVEMAGHRVAREVERERTLHLRRRAERQTEAQERVDEALLRALEIAPGRQAPRLGEIGDRTVQVAGSAERVGVRFGGEPIADAVGCVRAVAKQSAVAAVDLAEKARLRGRGFERNDRKRLRVEAQDVAAVDAHDVLEVDLVAAFRAGEVLHALVLLAAPSAEAARILRNVVAKSRQPAHSIGQPGNRIQFSSNVILVRRAATHNPLRAFGFSILPV